ncbi:MAG: hypothetical protein ABSG87_05325 [Verrucomicrobiota bacterium]
MPPKKTNYAGNENKKNQPAEPAAAFFASGVKRLEMGLARHKRSFKFQVLSFKPFILILVVFLILQF